MKLVILRQLLFCEKTLLVQYIQNQILSFIVLLGLNLMDQILNCTIGGSKLVGR